MSNLQKIINPCFPRSGHRFLRQLSKSYFQDEMVFEAVRARTSAARLRAANYIKDHEFSIREGKPGRKIEPGFRYLVQYRHPLECNASYFEFATRLGRESDTKDSWQRFLEANLVYWKNFVGKWCLAKETKSNPAVFRVEYSDLCNDPEGTLSRVVEFATAGLDHLDNQRIRAVAFKHAGKFVRYAVDTHNPDKVLTSRRNITDFKYFDDTFEQIERSLAEDFLLPLGIKPLLI